MGVSKPPKGVFVAGNGVYVECRWCGKIVRLNKFLFGSLHFCLTPEERAEVDENSEPPKFTERL